MAIAIEAPTKARASPKRDVPESLSMCESASIELC